MKEKILTLLGSLLLMIGIGLLMCLPYAESFPLWNARMGGLIGVPMIVMGIAIMGMVAEKR